MWLRLIAYSAPVVAGLVVPCLLSRNCPKGWSHVGMGIGSLILLTAIVMLASGVPIGPTSQLVAYVLVMALFFGGLQSLLGRISRPGAQIVCGLVLAAMVATVFCSDLLMEGADTKAETDRVVWWSSNASPVIVVGTILSDDPAHQPVMYRVSRIADYGVARADLPFTLPVLGAIGAVLLAIHVASILIRKKNGPTPVLPPDSVQTPG